MPGEPMTRRGRASRERIVKRAAELFAERGIAATTVDEVLAAAGAGKGQFYHYFRSRDELAAAAVGHPWPQGIPGLTQALGGRSPLGAGRARARVGPGPIGVFISPPLSWNPWACRVPPGLGGCPPGPAPPASLLAPRRGMLTLLLLCAVQFLDVADSSIMNV